MNIFKEQFQVHLEAKIPANMLNSPTKEESGSSRDEIDSVNVEVVRGNIVQESTDAIGFLVENDITQGRMYYENFFTWTPLILSVTLALI